ncbi:hypothetical protein C9439_03430 [archaeon SCG-AAA382B04]|nr:hypothetical protein C9439_03430 [archaeon SCG-AAA382B04]
MSRKIKILFLLISVIIITMFTLGGIGNDRGIPGTDVPKKLNSFNRTKVIRGEKAKDITKSLHQNPRQINRIQKAIILKYNIPNSSYLKLYVSYYQTSGDAEASIEKMAREIEKPLYTDPIRKEIRGIKTYIGSIKGNNFIFWNNQKITYWLTYPKSPELKKEKLLQVINSAFSR